MTACRLHARIKLWVYSRIDSLMLAILSRHDVSHGQMEFTLRCFLCVYCF